MIVDEGLKQFPNDSNLNFFKAVLSYNEKFMDLVKEDDIMLDTFKSCVDFMVDEMGLELGARSGSTTNVHVCCDTGNYSLSVKAIFKKMIYTIKIKLYQDRIKHRRIKVMTYIGLINFLLFVAIAAGLAAWLLV